MSDPQNGVRSASESETGRSRDGPRLVVHVDEHDSSWVFNEEALEKPPTLTRRTQHVKAPVTLQQEREWRREAVGHIQTTVGLLVKMQPPVDVPVTVVATAATLLHRFYMFQSFHEFRRLHMATACLLVAMKSSTEYIVSKYARAGTVLQKSLEAAGMTGEHVDTKSSKHEQHMTEVGVQNTSDGYGKQPPMAHRDIQFDSVVCCLNVCSIV
eukprot:m.145832 g.145832  ORF g.145832 m.145832 type:complete len:212 (+) comp17744_c0_seq2:418-1053(+)